MRLEFVPSIYNSLSVQNKTPKKLRNNTSHRWTVCSSEFQTTIFFL